MSDQQKKDIVIKKVDAPTIKETKNQKPTEEIDMSPNLNKLMSFAVYVKRNY